MTNTDELIQQALENLENTQNKTDEAEEGAIQESTGEQKREQVAKIDVQQYVEKEAYMRLAADFDNFRRRALKERQEWEKQGREAVLRPLLDVLDNFGRGIEQAKDEESPLATGMTMIYSQMEQLLVSQGLRRIPTKGEKFNPEFHEAVAKIPSKEFEVNTIIEEVKCGFTWQDRLLRPASVVVSAEVEKSVAESEASSDTKNSNE